MFEKHDEILMSTVLLIAPNFHYFAQSISRAFAQAGCHVHCEVFDNPIHPYTRINRVRYKFGDKETLKAQSREQYSSYILQVFHDRQPNLVFIVNGDMLLPEVVEEMHQTSKVAVWMFDSIKRFPIALPNLKFADAVFCYEQTDINYLREKMEIEAHFLPQAADLDLYHPMKIKKDFDIVFAGDLWQSGKRKKVIQAVVAHYPDKKIHVWGVYKPWYKNPIQWLFRERRDVYTNCNATAEQLNLDYNRAKIVLNIHHEQQKDGANPKVFEICASGAYQICDANTYIEQLFPNGEVGLYRSEEELFSLIDYALNHDMSESASTAYHSVAQQHTFVNRMKTVLQVLNCL